MSEGVFHIVSEDVEKEHVSTNVEDVRMKKNGCKDGVKIFPSNYFGWNHSEVVEEPV